MKIRGVLLIITGIACMVVFTLLRGYTAFLALSTREASMPPHA